ncbi:flavin reductase, partial [Saccharothrix sp. NRRL B-16348]
FRCRTVRRIVVGDHVALVGEPLEIQHNTGNPPLVRFRGRYTSVA